MIIDCSWCRFMWTCPVAGLALGSGLGSGFPTNVAGSMVLSMLLEHLLRLVQAVLWQLAPEKEVHQHHLAWSGLGCENVKNASPSRCQ